MWSDGARGHGLAKTVESPALRGDDRAASDDFKNGNFFHSFFPKKCQARMATPAMMSSQPVDMPAKREEAAEEVLPGGASEAPGPAATLEVADPPGKAVVAVAVLVWLGVWSADMFGLSELPKMKVVPP